MTPGLPDEHLVDEIRKRLHIRIMPGKLLGHPPFRRSHANRKPTTGLIERAIERPERRTARDRRPSGKLPYLRRVDPRPWCRGWKRVLGQRVVRDLDPTTVGPGSAKA